MGTYINPGNSGFSGIADSDYVDKTMLIDLINQSIESDNPLTCVSRFRRSGKSFAAQMLVAYYGSGCDSHALFDDKKIAATEDYEKHINKYNVIRFDTASFLSTARLNGIAMKDVPLMILKALNRDLKDSYGVSGDDFIHNVISVVESSGKRFVFGIDEWDAVIRECKDDIYAQKAYVAPLREWFKNGNFTPKAVAAAYMTGILPIKKFGSQSELNDFNEYTMIKPHKLSQFVGFTENEVKEICLKRNADFEKMKFWYGGYYYPEVGTIYNPYSVMRASEYNDFSTHWIQTVSPYALDEIIDRDYDGLQKAVAELVGGIEVKVNTDGFANDLVTFKGKDDVLTLLAHLGYLAYNREAETVHIPNEEIGKAFHYSIHYLTVEEGRKRLERSEKLFENTINMNEKGVAGAVESVHREATSPLHYNTEESL